MTRINETLNFLERHGALELAALKAQVPEHTSILEPDWAGVSSPAIRLRGEATLLALRQLEPTLAASLTRAVDRVRAGQRAEDAATQLTVVSTFVTTAAAAVPSVPGVVTIGSAILASAASLWTLRARRLGRMLFDRSIGAQTAVLAEARATVPQLITDLTAYLDPQDNTDHSDRVESILERANTLFREVNRASMEIDS